MRHSHRWMLCALALWAGTREVAAQEAASGETRALGRVLILDSQRCLEGDVEALGDRYRVRQGASEIWLPAQNVLGVCADWKSAYEFMKKRANLDDPDERLRLARWCQVNNMLVEASLEAKTALELRPGHAATRHLVSVLKDALEATRETAAPGARPAIAPQPAPSVDINPEASTAFANRVQPILMNACVSCHSGGTGGAFQLFRTAEGGHRIAAQRNISAVLGQVRFDQPELSPLLIKAVSRHGAASSSPLPGKKSVPYRTIEKWVVDVVASHPHLREQMARERPARDSEGFAERRPVPAAPDSPGLPLTPIVPAPASATPTRTAAPSTPEPPGAGLEPSRSPPIRRPDDAPGQDVYSEVDFNRVYHPRR